MTLDQADEVPLRIASKGGDAKMRVVRQEAFGRRPEIGEVAAPPAGYQDFGARLIGVFKQQNLAATLPSSQRAHQPCRASAKNDGVEIFRGCRHAPFP